MSTESEKKPMTQDEAFKKAYEMWGSGTVAGENLNCNGLKHVGVKGKYDTWKKRGTGKTFEEAFDNVRDNPDGKSPYTDL